MARINADSAASLRSSNECCRISREHVASSRDAIDKSLRLLNQTAKLRGD